MPLWVSFVFAGAVSAAFVPALRLAVPGLKRGTSVGAASAMRTPPLAVGGAAIMATLLVCAASIGALGSASVLAGCSLAVFAFGSLSEAKRLKPSTKLVALIMVASAFLFFGLRLHWSASLTADSLLTIVWVVAVTGAFHLLDNMDGLCAGIALIAGTAFLMTVLPLDAYGVAPERAQYVVILLGAIAGFLPYNVHPAKARLGEGGSMLIGLNMAAMTLQIAPGRGSDLLSIVAVPLLVLLIPILDGIVAALSSILSGTPQTESVPSSHRLVAIGLSERAAVGVLWLLAAISGTIAVVAGQTGLAITGFIAAMFTIGMALFALYLVRVRIHDQSERDALAGTIVPLGIAWGYRRRLVEVLLDLLLVSIAYYGAYRLRFEGLEFRDNFDYFLRSFAVVLGMQMLMLLVVGAYRGLWRYFSLSDVLTFASGVFLGVVTSQAVILYLYRFQGYSASVFIIYGMMLIILLVGSRASFRSFSELARRLRPSGRRLVIYGAGDAGALAVRHLLADPRGAYRILGFADDDVMKRNVRVYGYRVIGGYDHLVGMIMAGELDAVAVTAEGPDTAGLASLCAAHGVSLHRMRIDWREIQSPAVASVGASAPPVEGRVVPFSARSDALRDWPAVVHARSAPEPPPVRVVHIITRLILGGAQENTLYTAIGQHQDPRFDVTLLCGIDEAGEGNMFNEAARAGVRTVVLPSLLREIRPLTDLKAIFDVYRFLRDGNYAIVHTHSSKAGIVGRIAARLAGVPVVVHTLHGLAFHEYEAAWKNSMYIALERLCAPLSHRLISVSDRVSEAALAQGVGRRSQHLTVFSGIDLDVFLNVRERLTVAEAKTRVGIPAGAPVVGKVARLFPLKGHEQFLAAAVEIAAAVPDAYFLLVGDGPLREALRADAERLGLGTRLVMVGRVPPETVPEYLQAMDVVVHTSLREGIARVLPQAGAVGKPVVTFDLDGAPEVVRDGVSGYLIPPIDTHALAGRVAELLRDPARCAVLGDAGRAFAAAHFSIERMVERISTLYLELLPASAFRAGVAAR